VGEGREVEREAVSGPTGCGPTTEVAGSTYAMQSYVSMQVVVGYPGESPIVTEPPSVYVVVCDTRPV